MKNQTVTDILKDTQPVVHLTEEDFNALTIAIEKSIPKKVIDDFAHGLYGSCPGCFTIRSYGENYCSKCGQRIFFEVKRNAKQGN